MSHRYVSHEVRELAWAFNGPGLLAAKNVGKGTQNKNVVDDQTMKTLLAPFEEKLAALDLDPQPLLDFLSDQAESQGRLGRYFEALLKFFLVELKKVDFIASNVQIRENGLTKGELDLVFRDQPDSTPAHWEASVKFYICTTTDLNLSKDTRYFMGTLVQDRLDRKIEKLTKRQLSLPRTASAMRVLKELGLTTEPESRAVMKGFILYPSHLDWRKHPHPPELSPDHARGWWTSSDLCFLPQASPESRYMLLPPARWLAPFQGRVTMDALMTKAELLDHVSNFFDGPVTADSLHREIMVAEVGIDSTKGGWLEVTELSRGNILHAAWTEMAALAATEPAGTDEGVS